MSHSGLLGSKRFLPLFCTQFLGALNDNVYKNSLVIFITFSLADRAAMDASVLVVIAGGVFILPYFLFSATAGQLADKYEKGMLIRRIKVAEIMVMSLAAVGFMLQDINMLMVVLFLMGAQSTFFGPLKYGILPQHLDVDELTAGNGLVQMGTFLAILLGTIVGGLLIAIGGAGIWLVSAAVIGIAIAGWAASRGIPEAAPFEADLKLDWNLARQTDRILRYARNDRDIFTAILANSWFWAVGATVLSLVPGLTRNVLHGSELVATLLLFALSLGIGAGSVLCDRLSRGHIEPGLVPLGAVGLTLFPLDLYLAGGPPAGAVQALGPVQVLTQWPHLHVLLDLVLIGFCGGIYIVPLYALIQHRSSPEHRARVIAANNIMNALFVVLSAVAVTVLLRFSVGLIAIFAVLAGCNILVNAVVFTRSGEYLHATPPLLQSWLGRGGNGPSSG